MSKYDSLWEYVQKNGSECFKLSFAEIESFIKIPIDHSFLKYKKELEEYRLSHRENIHEGAERRFS